MTRAIDQKKGKWATPDWVYNPLNRLLRFDLDCAASPDNARCRRFYSLEKSGLEHPWDGRSNWCNPPYGQDPGTDVWVGIGRRWTMELRTRTTMLVPVKADTRWYHELVWGSNRVVDSRLLRGELPGRWYRLEEQWGHVELLELLGRVPFDGEASPGFFASAVVLFNSGRRPVLPQLG